MSKGAQKQSVEKHHLRIVNDSFESPVESDQASSDPYSFKETDDVLQHVEEEESVL